MSIPRDLAALRINAKEMKVLSELIDYALECARAECNSLIGGSESALDLFVEARERVDRFEGLVKSLRKPAASSQKLGAIP